MNYITRWLDRRRCRRESDAISKRQHEEVRVKFAKESILEHLDRVKKSLSELEFRSMSCYSGNSAWTMVSVITIGPDKRIYKLEVYHKGGYSLEPLIQN